jgi:hypothetical protein
MAKLSVKVATDKLIKALEDRLVQMTSDYEKQPGILDKYQKEKDKWIKECINYILANGKSNCTPEYVNTLSTNLLSVNCGFYINKSDFRPEPICPKTMSDFEFNEAVQNINNAINILKLTDEPFVSASTYSAATKYL